MENFVYHKNAIPFYLIIVNILWIVNVSYFFAINTEEMEIFRKKMYTFSIIIYCVVAVVCAFGTYFEFRLIIEKNKNYVPFNEVKQEMSMISEVKDEKIG